MAAEEAEGLCARYAEAGIACAHIADLTPREEGLVLVEDGVEKPLPCFDADEITKVF